MSTQGLRAAIYLRISLDREQTRLGVDRHRQDAEELASRRGYAVVEVYEDNDISGAGGRKRPGFERMMADIEAGLIDVVVAQEWPRLERNRTEGVRLIEACKERKVLIALVKGNDIDMTTAGGTLIADFMSSLARHEIEVKSERQSRAQRQRADQGRPPKGARPLGYAVDGSTIPHEAEAVRAIFSAFAAGASLLGIARALSGDPMLAPGDDGKRAIPAVPAIQRHDRTLAIERNARREEENKHLPKEQHRLIRPVPEAKAWTPSTVLGILRNPRYAGFSTYQKKSERLTGHAQDDQTRLSKRRAMRDAIVRGEDGKPVPPSGWEGIVPESQWWAVQAILDDEKRATNRVGTERRHIGSGIYRCGECEEPIRSHGKLYACKDNHVHRSRGIIDDYVIGEIRDRLAQPDLADLLPSSENEKVVAVIAQLDSVRADLKRAEDDYIGKLIDGGLYRRIKDQAEVELARLEHERVKLTSGAAVAGVTGSTSPVAAFDEADLATRRSVISDLCDVYLYPHPRGKKGIGEGTVRIVWKS